MKALLAAAAAVALLAGCSSGGGGTFTSPTAATTDTPTDTALPTDTLIPIEAAPSVLVYTVHSDAANLTAVSYFNNDGQTQATHTPSGTWTKTITPNAVRFPILVAVGDYQTGTFIQCSITVDGVVVAHNQANGPGASVSCSPH